MTPEIPEGYRLVWLQIFYDPFSGMKQHHYEASIERTEGSNSSDTWYRIDGKGEKWQDAIQDAVSKIDDPPSCRIRR